jgi:hypothetical protein
VSDSESARDLSSDVSEMSCSEYSEGSVSSSVSGAGSCRRSSRVKKPNLLHTEEEVFKVPKSPVKGDRCGNCGRFFKNLKRHKKCSGKDSRTVKEHEVATVSDSVESSEVEIDITNELRENATVSGTTFRRDENRVKQSANRDWRC